MYFNIIENCVKFFFNNNDGIAKKDTNNVEVDICLLSAITSKCKCEKKVSIKYKMNSRPIYLIVLGMAAGSGKTSFVKHLGKLQNSKAYLINLDPACQQILSTTKTQEAISVQIIV